MTGKATVRRGRKNQNNQMQRAEPEVYAEHEQLTGAVTDLRRQEQEQNARRTVSERIRPEKPDVRSQNAGFRGLTDSLRRDLQETAKRQAEEDARLREAERQRLAREAEQRRLAQEAEKRRLAAEAEQQRLAAEAAERQRLAEEQRRLAQAAERQRPVQETAQRRPGTAEHGGVLSAEAATEVFDEEDTFFVAEDTEEAPAGDIKGAVAKRKPVSVPAEQERLKKVRSHKTAYERETRDGDQVRIITSPKLAKAKRAMLFWALCGIAVICCISVIIAIRYDRMRRELEASQDKLEMYRDLTRQSTNENNASEAFAEPAADGGSTTTREGESTDGVRRIYLTFDDGPSNVTVEVLDILKQYNVKATFFVLGRADAGSALIYKRIVEEGHTLAMHSYSHNYSQLYESLDSFQTDLHRLQNFLFDTTGVWCTYYRFPGGSSNTTSRVNMQDLADYLARQHITYFDWNVYGGDDVSADRIIQNVTANVGGYTNAIVLLHDAADKEETARALPGIIEYILSMEDTEILPITEETVPVQHLQ